MSTTLRRPPVAHGDRVRILAPFSIGPAMAAALQHLVGRVGIIRSGPDPDGDMLVEVFDIDEAVTYHISEWERIEDDARPEGHGLPRRDKDFEVLLEATVKVTVQVNSVQSEEEAFAQARGILRLSHTLTEVSEVLSVENVAAYEV